ncbi:hypothetical protein Droror1_Dr00024395 [Drosera rotundifolia]
MANPFSTVYPCQLLRFESESLAALACGILARGELPVVLRVHEASSCSSWSKTLLAAGVSNASSSLPSPLVDSCGLVVRLFGEVVRVVGLIHRLSGAAVWCGCAGAWFDPSAEIVAVGCFVLKVEWSELKLVVFVQVRSSLD